MAAGRLLLTAEATKDGHEVVCAILDIDKCYEHVEHRCIQIRRMRCLLTFGSVARPCQDALWLMQMIMTRRLDQFLEALFFDVEWAVYVDDVTLQVVDDRRERVQKASQVIHVLSQALQEGADLPESRSKARVVSSCSLTAKNVAADWDYINFQTV